MGYFDRNPSGTLKTILVDRMEDIEKTLAHLLPEMTANLLIPIAMIIWMLVINFKLTAIIFLWIVFGLSIGMLMMIGYKQKYEGASTGTKEYESSGYRVCKGH